MQKKKKTRSISHSCKIHGRLVSRENQKGGGKADWSDRFAVLIPMIFTDFSLSDCALTDPGYVRIMAGRRAYTFIFARVCVHFLLERCVLTDLLAVAGCIGNRPRWAEWSRRSPRERKVPGSNPACADIFPGSSYASDFKIGLAL